MEKMEWDFAATAAVLVTVLVVLVLSTAVVVLPVQGRWIKQY
jgi:hypothetical protein